MDKQALQARYPEAFVYLAARGVEPSDAFYARLEVLRQSAWTVAKLAAVGQIEQVKASLVKALQQGQSFYDWQKNLTPEMLVLPKHYRELVFRNAVQSSYNGAKWAHFRDNPDRPILRYIAVNDHRTRPAHHALHGFMAHIDDPRWQTLAPSNGHGCRCSLMSLSEKQARALGYNGRQDTPTWTDKHGVEHTCAPDKGWAHSPEQNDLGALLREREQKAGLSHAVFDSGTQSPKPYVPPLEGTAESQIRYDIITRGQAEGVEYAALIGEGGLLLAMVRGETGRVDLKEIPERTPNVREIIHNHPSGMSLSHADLQVSAQYGVQITALATWSVGEFTARAKVAGTVLYAKHYEVSKKVSSFLREQHKKTPLKREEGEALSFHLINLLLEKEKIISYNVKQYSPSLTAALNKVRLEDLFREP